MHLFDLVVGGRLRAVKIRDLKVPEYLELKSANNEENTNEDIVLDCDFDYEESEAKELVVKWYFNGDSKQWAPFMYSGCAGKKLFFF